MPKSGESSVQQKMRRWIPPRPAPRLPDDLNDAPAATLRVRPADAARPLDPSQVPARDLAFCAEFAVHGGVARSEGGFKGEADLLRMQQSGLLELTRDPAPPFDVIEVRLSSAARALLSPPDDRPQQAPVPPARGPGRPAGPVDGAERRNGFEIARGMIGAAVKAEIGAWKDQGGPGGPAALEARLMARIIQLNVPLPV